MKVIKYSEFDKNTILYEISAITKERFLYIIDYYFKYKTLKPKYKRYYFSLLIEKFVKHIIRNVRNPSQIEMAINNLHKLTNIDKKEIKNIVFSNTYEEILKTYSEI